MLGWVMNRGSLLHHPLNLAQFVAVVSMPFIPAEGAACYWLSRGHARTSMAWRMRAGCKLHSTPPLSSLPLPSVLLHQGICSR